MKLPRASEAIVDPSKLRNYCLSAEHPRGRHKARVFYAALGVTESNAEDLQTALLFAVFERDAVEGVSDQFGIRYVIDFQWTRGLRIATSAVHGLSRVPVIHLDFLPVLFCRRAK